MANLALLPIYQDSVSLDPTAWSSCRQHRSWLRPASICIGAEQRHAAIDWDEQRRGRCKAPSLRTTRSELAQEDPSALIATELAKRVLQVSNTGVSEGLGSVVHAAILLRQCRHALPVTVRGSTDARDLLRG